MRCALLHGFAGTPGAWHDVIEAWQLPASPHAIALPGHGGGPVQPTWDANLDAVAREITGFDVVVGYSLGARVALGLVATGRCARGVLISVNPGIDNHERPERRISDGHWSRLLREKGIAAFVQGWSALPLFATQTRAPEAARAARRVQRLALDPEQLAQSIEVMGLGAMPDYRPQLPALGDRVSLIVGCEDTKFAAVARQVPGVTLDELPDCGHDPTLEQPELLAKTIARAVVRLA